MHEGADKEEKLWRDTPMSLVNPVDRHNIEPHASNSIPGSAEWRGGRAGAVGERTHEQEDPARTVEQQERIKRLDSMIERRLRERSEVAPMQIPKCKHRTTGKRDRANDNAD